MEENRTKIIIERFKTTVDIETTDSLYIQIYNHISNEMAHIFASYHELLNNYFKEMNRRSKTDHYFRAEDSRQLINICENLKKYQGLLKNTSYTFSIVESYKKHLDYIQSFLRLSMGSEIPVDYNEIDIIEFDPIFVVDEINNNVFLGNQYHLKYNFIGEGAFANVYSFKDPLTKKKYAMKKLKKGFTDRELARFKKEYDLMKSIKNPHILEVYTYNSNNNSYTMEYCETSLKKFVNQNNNKDFMNFVYRKNIAIGLLRGLHYLHKKGILHRDLSSNNVLLKCYDDNIVMVKISDFGLVKDIDSDFTKTDSDIKGTLLDDTLENFKLYDIKNEIYSIGCLIWFIFKGKRNLNNDDSDIGKIVDKCTTRNVHARYNSIEEIYKDLKKANDES